ncbi:hypothetical protein Zmor_021192 [Zophobas morio]|uniref:Peptidase S1 domain-containing protein n=1 Tax=Zophobas morio TaxID=2755281 RepID=A0AA38I740_9CUCU|nr:hypothetical protein Zmor_021192 [Zophobas morio]
MFRFAFLYLCASSVWALSSPADRYQMIIKLFPGPRIINGEQAAEGQFPWQVGLNVNGFWFCGGSIISEEWILTAGHCVDGAESAEVVIGSTDIDAGETVTASQFILHEDYDGDLIANDIGLIKLDKPLTLSGNIAAVNLASEELNADVDVTVSGWGLTSDDSLFISQYLNFVELVTITNEKCGETYGQDLIRPEMVCATSPVSQVKSTCSGDSGGPVVINADSDPVHVAIASFVGDTGCEAGTPSGYTRTAYYREWIKTNTGV